MTRLSCFRSYDIRGRIGADLNDELAFALGKAVVHELGARSVVVGHDARAESPALLEALALGLQTAGAEVLDLGLCGTEEVYFGTAHFGACAGVMVTASHNPIDYNGFKLVARGAHPLSDAEFRKIEFSTATGGVYDADAKGRRRAVTCRDAYVERVVSFVDPTSLAPLHLVANSGNGAAGPTLDSIADGLASYGAPLRISRVHHEPDSSFPNGIPNPLLPENRPATAEAVIACDADIGVAFDGDFDRCFFFDEAGDYVPGEYVVGILARAVLAHQPHSRIVHDPRIIWNTQRMVGEAGGTAVVSKTGHALVKSKMRKANAAYGGEMSGHHYFQDFMYCDSGMLPWLLVTAELSNAGHSLRSLTRELRDRHPSSGEINFRSPDQMAATQAVLRRFKDDAQSIDWLDGLSVNFKDWRFNLRSSNTEPLLRLNVEALGQSDLVDDGVAEITSILDNMSMTTQKTKELV